MQRSIDRAEARRLEIEPWDQLAPARARDLDAGRDASFKHVLAPTSFELLAHSRRSFNHLLDVGCGVGRLTARLQGVALQTTAIDPSPVSADFARQVLPLSVDVRTQTIQDYASERRANTHDSCVAVMVMQDVVDLDDFLGAVRTVVRKKGILVAAITHPFFWANYWGYDKSAWFKYSKEIFVASEFRISSESYGIETLHVHRPLDWYLGRLAKARFRVTRLPEPMMPIKAQKETGVSWKYPHFLFVVAEAF